MYNKQMVCEYIINNAKTEGYSSEVVEFAKINLQIESLKQKLETAKTETVKNYKNISSKVWHIVNNDAIQATKQAKQIGLDTDKIAQIASLGLDIDKLIALAKQAK
jgi:hypothetical protein